MSNTFEAICERIENRMENPASKIEGTWNADNIQAVANELARMHSQDIDPILDKAFVATAMGEYLDLACNDYGMERRKAQCAEVNVTVTGSEGHYKGIRAAAGELTFILDDFVIGNSKEAVVRAVCETAGEAGNALSGTINKIIEGDGLNSIINKNDATGGYDEEDDESFRQRTQEKISNPPTSGNIAHYRMWALEVSGVEKVRVYPLARGNGTVDVAVIADGNKKAPEILLENVLENIELQRPIGADVKVLAAVPVEINVSAVVMVKDGYTADIIKTELFEQLDAYCKAMPFTNSNITNTVSETIISYVKIADLLFACEGIIDVESYMVNNMNKSLSLSIKEFPVAVNPTITIYGGS